MARVRFDRDDCSDPAKRLTYEWLEVNGLGGFASATICGAHTRRYHGLLLAAIQPPAVRCLLLSKLEETLVIGDDGHDRFELSTNIYPGAVYPAGYNYLTGFRLDPFPIFTFQAGGVTVEKRVFLVPGENTVVIEYQSDAEGSRIELRPLIAFRGFHDLTHANPALNASLIESDGLIEIQPYADLPRFWFAHSGSVTSSQGDWYFNFEYPMERERGLDFHEDLFCPFVIACELGAGKPAAVVASTTRHSAADLPALRAARLGSASPDSPLAAAGAQFIASRGAHKTIIAGFPWFGDWGRDTMIALPGLTLATGQFDVARHILLAFADCVDEGMLPNRFPDSGEAPEYNNVDATLWFFEAIRQYLDYTKDLRFIRIHLYEKLKEIVDWHLRGTRYGIHADSDGLLLAGDTTTQLTWMDARTDGRAVTPRNGKPVEIQALWYNALRFLARVARDLRDDDTSVSTGNLATKAGKNFNAAFWDDARGCLYDVIEGNGIDASLRPNQLIALSLRYCAIPESRARSILASVAQHLLTPFGLRTLAPSDLRYQGRYEGTLLDRDAAYHQGTVWPWLLGPFITADLRFNGDAARNRARRLLDSIETFMLSRGTGQLPEIFDGDAPHEPRGCFAQAWSVAEILRIRAEF